MRKKIIIIFCIISLCTSDGMQAMHAQEYPLHKAVTKGNIEQVNQLIANNADVNQPDNHGRTPLHLVHCHEDVATILLAHNADVNQRDYNGTTPLLLVARFGQLAVVQLLLDHHADVNQPDNFGETPLHVAAKNGHKATVKLLLDNNANVNQPNNCGQTPLCDCGPLIFESDCKAIAQLLLNHNADVNKSTNAGNTPLHLAVHRGRNEGMVKTLLAYNANVNQPNNYGQTPLSVAKRQEDIIVVKILQTALNGHKGEPDHTTVCGCKSWW